MSEPKTAIEEIKGRITVLESQIEHEKEQVTLSQQRADKALAAIEQLWALREQWEAVLVATTAAEAGR